jgi:N-acetylneuraminic acid mutarotase
MQQLSRGWQDLGPLPYGAVSDAILVSQANGADTCLYLMGGRRPGTGAATSYFSTVYSFCPETGKWNERSNIASDGRSTGLAAGTGCAIGGHLIALFGGDDGVLFNQLAEDKQLALLEKEPAIRSYRQQQYDSLFVHHPGFNRTVFIYDTNTDQWHAAGRLPFPVPVTTNVVSVGGIILLPLGEIRPGVRTADIWQLETAFDHS